MIKYIASNLFYAYAYILKDWFLIISCLFISLRIPLTFLKPIFSYLFKNVKSTGNRIADLDYLDEASRENEFMEIMKTDWYKFFVYPLIILVGILGGIKIVKGMTKTWILLSSQYKTSIFLPWIVDINLCDKYNVFGILCLISQVIREVYEYKVYHNKKNIFTYLFFIIIYGIQTILYRYTPVKYVVSFVILELWAYFNKRKCFYYLTQKNATINTQENVEKSL